MSWITRLIGRDRSCLGFLVLIAGLLLIACGGDTSGPATDPNAQLVLLEPIGGETYSTGDSLHVR